MCENFTIKEADALISIKNSTMWTDLFQAKLTKLLYELIVFFANNKNKSFKSELFPIAWNSIKNLTTVLLLTSSETFSTFFPNKLQFYLNKYCATCVPIPRYTAINNGFRYVYFSLHHISTFFQLASILHNTLFKVKHWCRGGLSLSLSHHFRMTGQKKIKVSMKLNYYVLTPTLISSKAAYVLYVGLVCLT